MIKDLLSIIDKRDNLNSKIRILKNEIKNLKGKGKSTAEKEEELKLTQQVYKQIADLLNEKEAFLSLSPDRIYQALNVVNSKEKQDFLRQHLKLNQFSAFIKYNNRYPLFQNAVKDLANLYENLNPQNLKEIEAQHVHINQLLSLLAKHEKGNEHILSQVNLDKAKDIQAIEMFLLDEIKKAKVEVTPPKSPITKAAIAMQAELFRTEREAKTWAATQTHIGRPEVESVNQVLKMQADSTNKKAIGFFKQSLGGEKASGIMEKLCWEIALILGVEENFTPTKQSSVRLLAEDGSKGESVRLLSHTGDFEEVSNLAKAKEGGFQVAQEGQLLSDYVENPGNVVVSPPQLIKGALSSLIFGMFDAHSNNIFVDKEGNIKFFDNTRSLPNNNSPIKWAGENLLPPFRSGLQKLPGYSKDFTAEERAFTKAEIIKSKEKLAELEKYLNNPQIKKQLSQLPNGWFNQIKALQAMKERIHNMEKAIEDPNVKNLLDLTFATIPDAKFYSLLQMLHMKDESPKNSKEVIFSQGPSKVGSVDVVELFQKAVKYGIDLKALRKKCNDPNFSYETLFNSIMDRFEDYRRDRIPSQDLEKASLMKRELMDELDEMAEIDFKDVPREEIPKKCRAIIENKLMEQHQSFDYFHKLKDPLGFTFSFDKSSLFLHYKTKAGTIKQLSLDYLTHPGFITIENQIVSVKDLINAFEEAKEGKSQTSFLQKILGLK